MKELKYYGIHAIEALFQTRPQDIIRVYVTSSNLKLFGPLLRYCAKEKKAYHIVEEQDLQNLADSIHHEGIVVLAKELFPLKEKNLRLEGSQCLLYLDGIENPHNLGSILRSAAHFHVPYILGEKLLSLSPSACRVAQGGAERVRLVSVEGSKETLLRLKSKGFQIVATSSHQGQSLYQTKLSPKVVFLIGAESEGLSKTFFKLADKTLSIPGNSHVESLNVSVATGVFLSEYNRQHPVC